MCGIAGGVGRLAHTAEVDAMARSLAHRGPDDVGVDPRVSSDGEHVRLASTRLAIIDLSANGHMPMVDPASGNRIVYNGEVYNFRQLREELTQLGERFRTETDTEVLLVAYRRWGRQCVSRLRGMFAFAIWDAARHELVLARDRMGKKPLYYYYEPSGGGFLFASEVRGLLASGCVPRQLNPAALEIFLCNGFLVAPETMVRGVRSVLPGHWLVVDGEGRITECHRYWQLPRPRRRAARSAAEVLAEAEHVVEEAVRLRLLSDVPLGAFLSGGLDSSAIVALMSHCASDVRTFSIAFTEQRYDESRFSRRVASAFGTRHAEVRLDADAFRGWLPGALAAMDQPSFDGVNTYFVARAARERGLTVALSGLGADELFGGYPFFRTVTTLSRAARWSRVVPAWLKQRIPTPRAHRLNKAWKTLELLEPRESVNAPGLLKAYQTAQTLFPSWARRSLIESDVAAADEADVQFGLPAEFRHFVAAEYGPEDPVAGVSNLALRLFLGERCLRDTDSMSMGVSLEVRAPFTDHAFIETITGLPGPRRCLGSPDKLVEWQLMHRWLGNELPFRRKQGFEFPFEAWLRKSAIAGDIRARLHDAAAMRRVGLNPPAVAAVAERFYDAGAAVPWSRIWALFAFSEWCERNRVYLA